LTKIFKMKNILVIVAVVIGSLVSKQLAAQKLGHIDSQALLQTMPERATAQAKVEEFAKQLEKSIQEMGTTYQTKVSAYQAGQEKMTNTERESAVAEIQDLEERIQKFRVSADERLQKQQQELLQPMIDKAKKAIEEVGAENGFTYIFDSSVGVTVYEGGEDVLPLVKKKLGL